MPKKLTINRKPSRLLHEFKSPYNGAWIGHVDKWINDQDRVEAEEFLQENPDRYYYPKHGGGKIRISHADW